MQLSIAPDGSINSRKTITNDYTAWNQEVGPGNASKIAVGGDNMMFLRGDQAAFAKTGQGGSWTQVTGASSTSAIAVSATTLLAIIGTNNAIYSQQGITPSNWLQEVGPGNAAAIALAGSNNPGNYQMFLRGDGAVFARTDQGTTWTQETNPSSATAIAIGADGLQVMLVVNGEVDTRPLPFGFGGWTAETSASSATAIAASQ